MVQTDTIVGVVGAVVLVGVMAGVFVYEYNNQPVIDDGGGSGDFVEMYPGLVAEEDIDGDGTVNAEDDDLDGDGTPNGDDQDVVVVEDLGSVTLDRHAPPLVTADPVEIPVEVGTGVLMFTVSGEYDAPLPGAQIGILLLDATGETVAQGTDDGGDLRLNVPGTMEAGQYTLRLSQEAASDQIQITGLTATVSYAWVADGTDA